MTTAEVLRAFGETNLAAGAAILVVALLRKPARRFFGPRVSYGLWAIPPVAAAAVLLPAKTVVRTVAAPGGSVAPAAGVEPLAPLPDFAMPPTTASGDPWTLLLWAWIAGAAVMLMWMAVHQARFLAQVRDGEAGPAVVGLVRPRIVTPADFAARFSPREQAVILAHEKAHLARGDAQVNAIASLVRCLCWFNPLAHLGAHLMRIDQELACDAMVVERHPRARKPYAKALLKAQLASRPLPLGCYWPAGGEHPLTERVLLLKAAARRPRRTAAGALVVGLVAGGAGFAAWAAQPPTTLVRTLSAPSQAPSPVLRPVLPVGPSEPLRSSAAPSVLSRRPDIIADEPPPASPPSVLSPASPPAYAGELPPWAPSRAQSSAWNRMIAYASDSGFSERTRPSPEDARRRVELKGRLDFADGSTAPLNLSVSAGGHYRTVFRGGAATTSFTPRGDKVGVSTIVAYGDGRIVAYGETQVASGEPAGIAIPDVGAFAVTATARDPSPREGAAVEASRPALAAAEEERQ